MRITLLILLFLACAGFAQVDTSILKAGNTWTYEYGTENRVTGQLESGFKGTAAFRIDTVRRSGPDSIVCSVSRTDSGTSGKTLTRTTYVLAFGKWRSDAPGQTEDPPRFAVSGLFAKPSRWAVLGGVGGAGGDTLRYNQGGGFTSCVSTSSHYLESVGLLHFTYFALCGLTSTEMHYHLMSYNGKPFQDSDLKALPLTSDFAPYSFGKYWEYRVVENRTESQPITNSVFNSVDSLLWSFQVVSLGRFSDSMIVLEAHIQGRKGIGKPLSPRGDTVDVHYLDTVQFRGGVAYPLWDPKLQGGTRIVFDHYAAFMPFYAMHGVDPLHLPGGAVIRDTVMDGQSRKLIAEGEGKVGSPAAYAQGIGLVHKEYWGNFTVMPSSGTYTWIGNIDLLGTGTRPVGILPPEGKAFRRGRPAAGAGICAGAARFEGRWFGADGRRLAPIR
jgi:hypothetical protein